jgi:hypothetical protein
MKIILYNRIPSKKNAKIISCRGSRPMLFPSANHKKWHIDASKQLIGQKPIPPNIPITFTYYAPDNRAGDLSNKFESVADLLVDNGLIEDDNWFILDDIRLKFGGVVDQKECRGEISF